MIGEYAVPAANGSLEAFTRSEADAAVRAVRKAAAVPPRGCSAPSAAGRRAALPEARSAPGRSCRHHVRARPCRRPDPEMPDGPDRTKRRPAIAPHAGARGRHRHAHAPSPWTGRSSPATTAGTARQRFRRDAESIDRCDGGAWSWAKDDSYRRCLQAPGTTARPPQDSECRRVTGTNGHCNNAPAHGPDAMPQILPSNTSTIRISRMVPTVPLGA